jgi:hypothetical protein
MAVTFNHGVEGSSPSALTKQYQELSGTQEPNCFPEIPRWEVSGKERDAFAFLRRSLALPIYTVALILSYVSDMLADLAAWTAGDDWPA